jgi:hypothetical protein
MPKLKSTTNYSQDEIKRRAKASFEIALKRTIAKQKGVAASKKLNSTWVGNKKTKPKKANATAMLNAIGNRTTAQNRAIHAKKK